MESISPALFEKSRHDRTDDEIAKVIATCAQEYMPKLAKARPPAASAALVDCTRGRAASSRTNARCSLLAGNVGSARARTRRPSETAVAATSSRLRATNPSALHGAHADGADPDVWTRRGACATPVQKTISLQGLCNRFSSTSKHLVPKFAEYVDSTKDYNGVVRAIMRSVARTETLVMPFVEIVRSLCSSDSESAGGVNASLRAFVDEFVATRPFMVSASPDPLEDYDAFCRYAVRKDANLRVSEAIASLGFTPDLERLVGAALDVVEDPDSLYDKDTAVRFVGICLGRGSVYDPYRHGECSAETLAGVRERVLRLAREHGPHNIDNRARFALLDLHGNMTSKGDVAADANRKVRWSEGSRGAPRSYRR